MIGILRTSVLTDVVNENVGVLLSKHAASLYIMLLRVLTVSGLTNLFAQPNCCVAMWKHDY